MLGTLQHDDAVAAAATTATTATTTATATTVATATTATATKNNSSSYRVCTSHSLSNSFKVQLHSYSSHKSDDSTKIYMTELGQDIWS